MPITVLGLLKLIQISSCRHCSVMILAFEFHFIKSGLCAMQSRLTLTSGEPLYLFSTLSQHHDNRLAILCLSATPSLSIWLGSISMWSDWAFMVFYSWSILVVLSSREPLCNGDQTLWSSNSKFESLPLEDLCYTQNFREGSRIHLDVIRF